MPTIALTRGRAARVDDESFAQIGGLNWTYDTGSGYAVRKVKRDGRAVKVLMHRVITGALPGEDVDHINGDKLDNRRANLRRCTRAQNMWNTALSKSNRTGYKGITVVRRKDGSVRYRVQLRHENHRIHVGYYATAADAARAYDAKVLELRGEFARLNGR